MPRLLTEDRSMKRKMLAVLSLVGICLAVLVVEGVSQPPTTPPTPVPQPTTAPLPSAQPGPPPATSLAPNFATVEPRPQDWTFEQLVEALKGVRARQKELKAQEADLLAKMAEKVEEKRKDLNKAQEVLEQLRGEGTSTRNPASFDQGFPVKTEEKPPEKKSYDKKEEELPKKSNYEKK
jgi:hypothetical protein